MALITDGVMTDGLWLMPETAVAVVAAEAEVAVAMRAAAATVPAAKIARVRILIPSRVWEVGRAEAAH